MNAVTNAQQTDGKGPFRLNPYQKAAVRAYEADFAYLADMEFKDFAEFRAHLAQQVGDGHLTFIMLELNDPDMTAGEAQNRMSKAIDQMNDVFGALCRIDDEAAPAPGR